MIAQFLTIGLLGVMALFIVWSGYKSTRDQWLVWVACLAALARLLVAALNAYVGPLPGAEVDAVDYESFAYEVARTYEQKGQFVLASGRWGYGSLVGTLYILGGRSLAFPTLLNLVFALHFFTLIYRTAALLGSRRSARMAVLAAAFYPTSLFYGSVPLREQLLMWGLALFLYGVVNYVLDRDRIVNWRIAIGWVFSTWLNSGFVFIGFLLPFVWWLKASDSRRYFTTPGRLVFRAVGAFVLLSILTSAFFIFGGILDKVPERPTDLMDLDALSAMRARKASYGTGYLGYVPGSWGGFVLSLPLMILSFLFSPTPYEVILGSGSLVEGVKMLDSLSFLAMGLLSWQSIRNGIRTPRSKLCWVLVALLGLLVVVFSVGTANVGIAIRHRAKFAWLFLMVIAVWHPFLNRDRANRENERNNSGPPYRGGQFGWRSSIP